MSKKLYLEKKRHNNLKNVTHSLKCMRMGHGPQPMLPTLAESFPFQKMSFIWNLMGKYIDVIEYGEL